MRELMGYVLGKDKYKFYSIIVDNDKCYQMDAEFDLLDLDESKIVAEQKFKMFIDENDEVKFYFIDEYINQDITLDDLKNLINKKI